MTEEIVVGMGRLVVVNEPVLLTCLGLGSCVGVMLYDDEKKVAGLAHIMLPDSQRAKFAPHEQSSLLAENDEYSLKTFKNALLDMGYEIKDVARNKDEVIDKFEQINPYVFLLDFNISGVNTKSLVDEVFQVNNSANIVVANANEDSSYLELLNNGVLDIITRPLTKQKVELALDIVHSLRHLRFADIAIEKMLKKMYMMGCNPNSLKAKMVGGGNMFTNSQVSMRNIGEENVNSVYEILKNKNIAIVNKSVGGSVGKTVRFNTSDFSAEITSRDGKTHL